MTLSMKINGYLDGIIHGLPRYSQRSKVGCSWGEDVQAYVWYMDQCLISVFFLLSGSKADNACGQIHPTPAFRIDRVLADPKTSIYRSQTELFWIGECR